MSVCKVYEIQGPDPARIAGAVRCHRDSDGTCAVDDRSIPICTHHNETPWQIFVRDGWVYAVAIDTQRS